MSDSWQLQIAQSFNDLLIFSLIERLAFDRKGCVFIGSDEEVSIQHDGEGSGGRQNMMIVADKLYVRNRDAFFELGCYIIECAVGRYFEGDGLCFSEDGNVNLQCL